MSYTYTTSKQNKILFIDAINEIVTVKGQSELKDEHIKKIHQAYLNSKDIQKFARVVDLEEIQNALFGGDIESVHKSVKDHEKEADILRRKILDEIAQIGVENENKISCPNCPDAFLRPAFFDDLY